MASGKRIKGEDFISYRQRLWIQEKAYRFYRNKAMGNLSFNDCVDKIKGMLDEKENQKVS